MNKESDEDKGDSHSPDKVMPPKLDLETMIKRHKKNPIITANGMPFPCKSVFNPGAIKHKDKYVLLLRVEDQRSISHLVVADSDDGINFNIKNKYALSPDSTNNEHGVEDPRITQIDGTYYITHTAYSERGVSVALATTRDFETVNPKGLIFHPGSKNGVLHPEKVDGKFLLYHRPSEDRSIWVAYSKDLKSWEAGNSILGPGRFWYKVKIGEGAVPIKTDRGWLHILHGMQREKLYGLGVALFDLNDPTKLIRISESAILRPKELYERIGDVPNIVFTCGAIPEPDGTVKIYYGAADTSVCLATAKIDDLVDIALNH